MAERQATGMTNATYLVALGSNRPRSALLPPGRLIEQGIAALGKAPCRLLCASPVIDTAPIGPAQRRFANAAAMIETPLAPSALLRHLKLLEQRSGRRRGRRWGDRALDLDIILWSGGRHAVRGLTIPHSLFRERDFVLLPLTLLAPRWRDPLTGLTMRQLLHRLKKPRKLPEAG